MTADLEHVKEYISQLVSTSRKAQKEFEWGWTTQRSIDEVCRAAGMVIMKNGSALAQEAVGETGMGNVEGKLLKLNSIALGQWNVMKGKQTVGFMEVPGEPGVRMLCKPLGVIGCVMPSTNPIATVIGNSMMALKCRNSVIIAPHPQSAKTSGAAVVLIRQALKEIGAPEDLVLCIDPSEASIEATSELLKQCDCNIATGGAGMVKAVYSSGRPAFGVGQGNCQVLMDTDVADYSAPAGAIINCRMWDGGVPCTGEQTVHIPEEREADFIAAMQAGGAYLFDKEDDINALRDLIFPNGGPINRKVVGRTPYVVAQMLGKEIPENTTVLLVPNQHWGSQDALCREILFPIIRYTKYATFEEAVDHAIANLEKEGAGHSSSIWTSNEKHIEYAANLIPVGRFHVNQPTTGANNGIPPTITIGCGSWGNNSICENLEYYHLMNKTRVSVTLPNYRQMQPSDWNDFEPFSITTD